jgi:pimeloyl-ACP methyl ester carboxylesterase
MELDHHRGGSGEPLVLVHGLGHTWRGWKPMLPLLEPSFDVLAVDLAEVLRLYANAPGFDATLPHTFNRQPRGLDRIGCPVLVLWGTHDILLLPRQGRRFERIIPGCELRYLKGLGHTPMSDDPALLAEAIAEFAARPSRAPRAAAPA